MKAAEIKRPEVLNVNEENMKIELSSSQNVYNKETAELVDILIAPTLVISDKKEEGGIHDLPIDPKMFTEERFKEFNGLTYGLGKMVRLAELNLDTLIGVVGLYLQLHKKEDIIQRNARCRELEASLAGDFHKLTFGNLRNFLSCVIKTDADLQKIEGLQSGESRSNYTSVYNNYIQDRDYYTHGLLFFHYPEFDPVLRVKSATGEMQYIKYNKEVFVDNLMTHAYLTGILHQIEQVLQDQLMVKAGLK